MNFFDEFFIAIAVTIFWFIAKYLWNLWLKHEENIDGEFRFEPENNIVHIGLTNKCKNDIYFDFQKGICIRWGDKKYHKINLIENNNMNSFIPPQGGTQLKYSVNLNIILKNIINSKRFKVFIYTNKNKKFELHPSACQLKEWGLTTMGQYQDLVKDL